MSEDFLDWPVYGVDQRAKESRLAAGLRALTLHHRERCAAYARVLAALQLDPARIEGCEQVPFLPVSLFKTHRLVSVPEGEIYKTLTSSGTTGQVVSRVLLDRETSQRQARALAAIMGEVLGRERLPMVLVDTGSLLRDRSSWNARAAGVLGMMPLGRNHVFALNDALELDVDVMRTFVEASRGKRVLLFGFTFVVWQHFVPAMERAGLRFDDAILIHSGGWKKLAEQAVDNAEFKRRVSEATGIRRIHNFYGMAEQVGSVFLEGDDGLLHPPSFADVIVRDPVTLQVLPHGQAGVLQVLSLLPSSYPGHSLITEDLGAIVDEDRPGASWKGKSFVVHGRVPMAELRGCSDVVAAAGGEP